MPPHLPSSGHRLMKSLPFLGALLCIAALSTGPGSYIPSGSGDGRWMKEIIPIHRRSYHADFKHYYQNGAFVRATTMWSKRDQEIFE